MTEPIFREAVEAGRDQRRPDLHFRIEDVKRGNYAHSILGVPGARSIPFGSGTGGLRGAKMSLPVLDLPDAFP